MTNQTYNMISSAKRRKIMRLLGRRNYVMHKISIMKNILLATLFIIALSACGTLKISEIDRKLVSEGKKSLLVTQNREPLFYLTLIPAIIDPIIGEPVSIYIITVDGKEVVNRFKDKFKANVEVVVEPGLREIVAKCREKVNSWNRDINDESDETYQSRTQTINHTFEGGKKYRIYAKQYIGGCRMYIEPLK